MTDKHNVCFRLRNGKIRIWEYDSWSKALKASSNMDKHRVEGDPLTWVEPVKEIYDEQYECFMKVEKS